MSKDKRSALILADFRSENPPGANLPVTEPVEIYKNIHDILHKNERPGITLRAAGTPILIGWVNSDGLLYVGGALLFFVIIIAGTLWYGFRTFSGVFLPLRVAFLGAERLFF